MKRQRSYANRSLVIVRRESTSGGRSISKSGRDCAASNFGTNPISPNGLLPGWCARNDCLWRILLKKSARASEPNFSGTWACLPKKYVGGPPRFLIIQRAALATALR
jgi:hypothetical protein